MNKISQGILILLTLVIFGCGGSSSAVHEEPPHNYTPELYSFDLVDSYGTNTAVSNEVLVLDPTINYGLFDVYWKVNSLEDYRVNFLINDYPDLIDSVLISTERCGAGLWCDQGGGLVCEYNINLTVSCDTEADTTDISYLFQEIPQTLYLIVEICDIDSSYCEFDYYPVIME